MFTLPILPDEIRIPLDRYEVEPAKAGDPPVVICEYPGVVAYARPFDIEAASKYNDAIATAPTSRSLQATAVVHAHLTRIEGLDMQDPATGAAIPFDIANKAHKRSVPMDMRDAIYLALRSRATLSAVTEKNSGSPSVSGGTVSSASTVAEAAAS